MIGQLYIEGDLRVGGIIEGEVEVTGDIEIDDMATVKASLAGGDVSVRGHLTGPVVARKRLIVARSGSVIGDVRVARLAIADGATFSGKVSMGAGAVQAPRPAVKLPGPAVAPAGASSQAEVAPKAIVEKPADIVTVSPVVAAPTDGKDGKDGKAKPIPTQATPAKAPAAKALPVKAMPVKAMPAKAIAPKVKPKRR